MELYRAETVRRICGISPRTLDYWVTTGLVSPTRTHRSPNGRRSLFLFGFEDLVQIKIIKSLRDAGVTLPRIRVAVQKLREQAGGGWQAACLRTDGKDVYRVENGQSLETISRQGPNQFAFAIVALQRTRAHVKRELADKRHLPFDESRYDGKVRLFRR